MSSGRKRRRDGRKGTGDRTVLRGGRDAGYGSEPALRMNEAFRRSTRTQVPAWMAGLGPDDEVSVIIATGDAEPPVHAADLIGEMTRPGRLDDGTVIPAGSRIYRNARPRSRAEIESDPDVTWLRFGDLTDIVQSGSREGTVNIRQQAVLDAGRPAPMGESRTAIADIPPAFRRPDRPLPPALAGETNQVFAELGAGGARRVSSGGPQSREEAELFLPQALGASPEIVHAGPTGHIVHGDPLGSGRGRSTGVFAETLAAASGDQPAGGQAAPHGEDSLIIRAMEAVSPGLPARLAEGLGKDELTRLAPEIARAVTEARRLAEAAGDSYSRARELIAGRDVSRLVRTAAAAEAIPVRTSWTADAVLDHHSWLVKHYSASGPDLADYLAYLMRSVQEQAGAAGATVFLPVDLDGPAGPAQGHQLARIISRGLGEARTYQVTGPMVGKMHEVFSQIGLGIGFLDGAELPAPAGFAWLDRPWLLKEAAGYIMPFRAVSWEKTTQIVQRDGLSRSADAVRIILWTLSPDDVAFGRWSDPRRASRAATLIGDLTPQHLMLIPFGYQFTVNPGFEDQAAGLLALVHILWMFLGMELTASRAVPPASPPTARRAARSLRYGEVHVITLRRIAYLSDGPAGHRDVTRTCKWWVAGFYRHIDHYEDTDGEGRRRRHEATPAGRTGYVGDDDHDVCAVCLAAGQAVRVTAVHAHLRGPSWLPLKEPARGRTLHRLSR